jgi:hypothetical protein
MTKRRIEKDPPHPRLHKPVLLSGIVPRRRHVRDLPAVAARVQIDRTHAGDHRIEDILRRVMLRALVREQGRRDRHICLLKISDLFEKHL